MGDAVRAFEAALHVSGAVAAHDHFDVVSA